MRAASSLFAALTLWWAPAAIAQDLPKVTVGDKSYGADGMVVRKDVA